MKDSKKAIIIVVALFVVAVAIYAFPKATPKTDPDDIETWYTGQIFIKEVHINSNRTTSMYYLVSTNSFYSQLILQVSNGNGEQWTIIEVYSGDIFKMGEETYKLHGATREYARVSRIWENV